MNDRRQPSGIPLPSLGHVLLAVFFVCCARVLWIEYQQRTVAANSPAPQIDDPVERIQRIEALVEEGPAAVPELVELLSQTDPKIRTVALYGLGRLKQKETLQAVRQCLSDENSEVRRSALSVFGWICDDENEVISVAVQMLGDAGVTPRNLASHMLNSFGTKSIPRVVAQLHSPNAEARIATIELLTKIDNQRHDPAEVNDLLRTLLDDDDPQVRFSAIEAVATRGAATVDDVGNWLRDENVAVVNAGYRAVYALGDDGVRLLPQLQDRLEHLDSRIPDQIRVLRALQAAARPAAPAVARLMPSLQPTGQTHALETLRIIGAEPGEIERFLVPLLADGDSTVRVAAGKILTQVSPAEARRQVTRQLRSLEMKRHSLTGADLDALLGLGTLAQDAVPLLIRLLTHEQADVARQALRVLREIGAPAASAVPALQMLLGQTESGSQEFGLVMLALGGIGPAAASAAPHLLEVLNRPIPSHFIMPTRATRWPDRQIEAAWALGRMGDDAPAIQGALRNQLNLGPDLERLMPGETVELRRTVLESLARLQRDPDALLSDMVARLDDRAGPIRMQAALAIGLASGDRRRAVEPLSAALFDRNCYVRTAAALALQAIGPAAAQARPALAETVRDTRNHVPNFLRGMQRPAPARLVALGDNLEELSVAGAASRALAAVSTQPPDPGVASQ